MYIRRERSLKMSIKEEEDVQIDKHQNDTDVIQKVTSSSSKSSDNKETKNSTDKETKKESEDKEAKKSSKDSKESGKKIHHPPPPPPTTSSNAQSPSSSPRSPHPPPPHHEDSSSSSQSPSPSSHSSSSPPPSSSSPPPPTYPSPPHLSPPLPPPPSSSSSSPSSSSSSPPPESPPNDSSPPPEPEPQPEPPSSSPSPPPPFHQNPSPPPPPPPLPPVSENGPPKDSQPPPAPSVSPPPPISSGEIKSPPVPSPSPSTIPQTPNSPKSPIHLMPPNPPTEGSAPQPSDSSSPPSHHPTADSKHPSGSGHTNHHSNPKGGNPNNKQNNDSDNVKSLVGVGISIAVIIAFLAIVFFVRRRKYRRVARSPNPQYMPPANFTVKSDGYNYYVPKTGNGNNSGPNSSSGYSSEAQILGGTPDSAVIGTSKIMFSYDELAQITSGFSKKNIIGEGGFGCVYKGFMPDGKIVAVKQLKNSYGQVSREFKAEVEIISRVHHRHLVSLVGYCISEQHKLLVYEFVPNKTLEYHLHNKNLPVLDWAKRVKIAIGAAKGLAYLHEDCHPKIIHRDIKSANILLHDDFEAQVADFGLARLNDTTQTHVSTRVMGTFGYLAPEYASSGKLTDRSDVFSFGVVLLELITGRRPVDQTQPLGEESLVEWARPHLIEAIEKGDVSEVVDPRLEKHYVEREVFRMIETAASCVRHSAPKRPRMVQVVRALDNEGEMTDLTNGVKVGQSTTYDSCQYSQEIRNFRRMTVGSDDFSDSGASGDYTTSLDYTDSESQALNNTRRR